MSVGTEAEDTEGIQGISSRTAQHGADRRQRKKFPSWTSPGRESQEIIEVFFQSVLDKGYVSKIIIDLTFLFYDRHVRVDTKI